jgi:signal transduction histidine kinase/CheY-like chemotaxis protein
MNRSSPRSAALPREWCRAALDAVGDAVLALDEGGRIVDLNAVAEALTGLRDGAAHGQPARALLGAAEASGPAGDVARADGAERPPDDPVALALREGVAVDVPPGACVVASDGARIPVEGRALPLRDGEGRVTGAVLVLRDVRERRRAEEERAAIVARERAARAEAEDASRARDEFIATLSHELRTPLNSVLGWARLLRMGKLDAPGTSRAVEAIERGATTQAQIVDDLLDVARIERGQLRLDVRPLDLGAVVDAAIDAVRPAAAARGIRIGARFEPRVGQVAGDPGRMQQVAWNLLANAIKFTPPGGHVDVTLSGAGGGVELAVRDDGPGIPAEFMPHVFERFRQADSSTTRAHGGLGLGLAIVRHLVEAHGGTVAAESDGPGRGSTFRVSLPAHRVRPRAKDPEPVRAPAAARAAPPAPASLDSLRILVVDDDRDTLEVVRELLELAGAHVLSAASAADALRLVRREVPDVLVSDIGMPDEDGYDLIRAVRALAPEEGGKVPAAALTAFTQPDLREQALAAGYELYLAKPIEPGELTAAVARLAGRA